MQYELHEDGSLTELPMKNIDTGLGVERMAAILQGVESVFETDDLRPLVEFGEQRSGRSWGQDFETTRALGVLADHGRGGAFLLADGVVPSNEDRGYVLRRIMRRAMRQGHVLGIEGAVPRRALRARGRRDGRRLSRAEARVGDDRALGAGRGGELRPHARSRASACSPS